MQHTLYGYWRSGCSWRVRIALELKGIEYNYIPVDLSKLVGNTDQKLPEDYLGLNKMAQLPTLVIKDPVNEGDPELLTQSLPICEYLDELYPEKAPLVGSDPMVRMRVREISEIINSGTQPLQNLGVLRMVKEAELVALPSQFAEEECAPTGKGFAKHHILKGLAAVEDKLESFGGEKYCVGDSVTLADICLVPQMYNARRFMIDVDKYFPRCVAVDAHLATLEPFIKAHADSCSDAKK